MSACPAQRSSNKENTSTYICISEQMGLLGFLIGAQLRGCPQPTMSTPLPWSCRNSPVRSVHLLCAPAPPDTTCIWRRTADSWTRLAMGAAGLPGEALMTLPKPSFCTRKSTGGAMWRLPCLSSQLLWGRRWWPCSSPALRSSVLLPLEDVVLSAADEEKEVLTRLPLYPPSHLPEVLINVIVTSCPQWKCLGFWFLRNKKGSFQSHKIL